MPLINPEAPSIITFVDIDSVFHHLPLSDDCSYQSMNKTKLCNACARVVREYGLFLEEGCDRFLWRSLYGGYRWLAEGVGAVGRFGELCGEQWTAVEEETNLPCSRG